MMNDDEADVADVFEQVRAARRERSVRWLVVDTEQPIDESVWRSALRAMQQQVMVEKHRSVRVDHGLVRERDVKRLFVGRLRHTLSRTAEDAVNAAAYHAVAAVMVSRGHSAALHAKAATLHAALAVRSVTLRKAGDVLGWWR